MSCHHELLLASSLYKAQGLISLYDLPLPQAQQSAVDLSSQLAQQLRGEIDDKLNELELMLTGKVAATTDGKAALTDSKIEEIRWEARAGIKDLCFWFWAVADSVSGCKVQHFADAVCVCVYCWGGGGGDRGWY